jgi:hypothetical protein
MSPTASNICKGWLKAFDDLLDHWRPAGPEDGWPLDEDGERHRSAVQGRPAVSYQFLWDALGISK